MNLRVVGVASVVAVLAACGSSSSGSSTPPLQTAKDSCAAPADTDVRLGDGGRSMAIHLSGSASYTSSFDPTVLSPDNLVCILNALHTPDYVRDQISNTRALDGMQSAEWTGFRAQWTYHPDAGLNMTLIQK